MHRRTILLACTCAFLATGTQTASATPHYVLPGESLWSVATANGISVASLAAANGLAADTQIVSGTTINVSVGQYSTAETTTTTAGGGVTGSGGGHLVQPGDSLSSVAAANGITIPALAATNGLSPTAGIVIGTRLTIPSASSSTTASPCMSNCSTTGNVPNPTPVRVTGQQVGDIAQSYGMSRSLVQAIGWQESGFNNAALSTANARGVMQIIPGTWEFINKTLAGGSLNPASAHDNVAAGALYLRYLYRLKGGNRDATIGSYYQGPGRQYALPETQRYVTSVLGFKNWYVQNPK